MERAGFKTETVIFATRSAKKAENSGVLTQNPKLKTF